MKINNTADLMALYEANKGKIEDRLSGDSSKKKEILICGGTGCLSSKSGTIQANMEAFLKERNIDVEVIQTGCFGFCEKGPIVKIMPDDTFYSQVQVEDAEAILESHIVNGEIYTKRLYRNPETKKACETTSDIPFYAKQARLALANCGTISATSIEEYIGNKGYQALDKALNNMTNKEVIAEIKESGLRGRGGGGFPTGLKWELTERVEQEGPRFVVCNADEGDPGAFMDRSILEGDPHVVVEAMTINGYATKATHGFVYVRAEYPTAIKRLQNAIDQAREAGLLGKDILGSGFDFNIEIREGAGAFVCGEETALIASIEGNRGMPRNKPPFPAERGLWDQSTNVNNVETYASIPQIINNGAEWFAAKGTDTSNGTKVFALGGKVVNTGLVEVEMGVTLREVIYDIGGGIPGKRAFKAVQTGGPSGGCLVESQLDEIIDFNNLVSQGSMMGSGGMIVMDEDNCMVDIAKFYLEFTEEESCGKCTPCREGTKKLLEILNLISEGKGTMEDLDTLESLSLMIKSSSLCGLGQTAPNPVLSTLKHFRHEYEEHILEGRCRAGACSELTKLFINDKCIGCTKCARQCPVNCISGELKGLHVIDQNACIKCNACKVACPVDAIEVV